MALNAPLQRFRFRPHSSVKNDIVEPAILDRRLIRSLALRLLVAEIIWINHLRLRQWGMEVVAKDAVIHKNPRIAGKPAFKVAQYRFDIRPENGSVITKGLTRPRHNPTKRQNCRGGDQRLPRQCPANPL